MFKIIISLLTLIASTAYAQVGKHPINYTPFDLKHVTTGSELKELQEIWQDVSETVDSDLKDRIAYYSYRINTSGGSYDLVSMFYSPDVCGMQECPLRITSMEPYGKYKVLLDIISIFAIGYELYAVGPVTPKVHRNIFIAGSNSNAMWVYDEEQSAYVRGNDENN